MELEYFYCSCCGYEAHNIFVVYSSTTADSEWYICPECGNESSNFQEYGE